MKILGYRIQEGVYNEAPYKNVILYTELKNDKTFGICTDMHKIKYDHFINMLIEAKIGIDNVVGLEVNFYYDKYARPVQIVKV